jgi:putative effector of murein hydrolase
MIAESLIPILWSAVTISLYFASRRLHRSLRRWWSSPMLVTWIACGALILAFHTTYQDYLRGTGWMITLLGPATVAFALPIHEQRGLIRKHWPLLVVGVVAGSAIAFGSSWALAAALDLPQNVRASLLPRSVSTPFAMAASAKIGGLPELTASFTAVTGLFGAAVGDLMLTRLPLRSSFARGALLGMGAHGAGVAKAHELGQEEGAVAGLIMVFAGLLNVVIASFVGAIC